MSTYHKATLRHAALGDPSHPLHLASVKLREARVGYARRKMLEPTAKPRERRVWPERRRLVAAEREYSEILRSVEQGESSRGGTT